MGLTIAYSKIKKQNLVLIINDTYQRETLSVRPIWQPLITRVFNLHTKSSKQEKIFSIPVSELLKQFWSYLNATWSKNGGNMPTDPA